MGHFPGLTYGPHHHSRESLVGMGKNIKQKREAEQSHWKKKVTLSSSVPSPYWAHRTPQLSAHFQQNREDARGFCVLCCCCFLRAMGFNIQGHFPQLPDSQMHAASKIHAPAWEQGPDVTSSACLRVKTALC